MKPLVSIVIPVWNQEKYVAKAIESVLSQSYHNIELIVVDDGSTDHTPEIVKSYGKKLVYIRQKNQGAATALNVGAKRSKGTLVGWLSSDDVYFPKKIEEQVSYFEEHPDVSLVYTDFQIINGDGKVTSTVHSPYYSDRKEFIRQMIRGNFVNGSSILVRKRDLLKAGLFDPKMRYHADGDMWFRILKFGKFGHVAKDLLKYRWHERNASHDTAGMREYLYIYFDKILQNYKPSDLFDGKDERELRRKFYKFIGQATQQNGLHDLAFQHYLKSGEPTLVYFDLGRSYFISLLRDLRKKLKFL